MIQIRGITGEFADLGTPILFFSAPHACCHFEATSPCAASRAVKFVGPARKVHILYFSIARTKR